MKVLLPILPMNRDTLLKLINQLYCNDPLIKQIFQAAGIQLDSIDEKVSNFLLDLYFSSCSEKQLALYERIAGITAKTRQTVDDRREGLRAKWCSDGKSDMNLLQTVANSWKNGKTEISFVDGCITVNFIDEFGVPSDMEGLKVALEEVKPAHLPIAYVLKYLLIKDISIMTISDLGNQPLSYFAFIERG